MNLLSIFAKRPPVHLLHIGKTGGTAVKHALKPYAQGRRPLHLHPHAVRLADVPSGELVFFFLRDPLERFVSGFYSRQRQGRPRYNYPWSEAEAKAFSLFQTPDELGRALSSTDPILRATAQEAMQGIQHVRDHFTHWLGGLDQLRARKKDILLVGFQESLAADFEQLRRLLRLPPSVTLPTEGEAAHRNPVGLDRKLGDQAANNLREWYAADRMLYDRLRNGGVAAL